MTVTADERTEDRSRRPALGSLASMKRDIAERFAATAVEGLSLGDARRVVEEFLRSLVLCSMCGGTGEFTFERDLEIRTANPFHPMGPDEQRVVPQGVVAPCPACRGSEDAEAVGDPEWVAWHCRRGASTDDCRTDRKRREEVSNGHADCGWRIVLPLPAG